MNLPLRRLHDLRGCGERHPVAHVGVDPLQHLVVTIARGVQRAGLLLPETLHHVVIRNLQLFDTPILLGVGVLDLFASFLAVFGVLGAAMKDLSRSAWLLEIQRILSLSEVAGGRR